jgi:hypothetical protein
VIVLLQRPYACGTEASSELDGAHPPGTRIRTRFPSGATFNIVGPRVPADVDDRVSNNIENGTFAARVLAPRILECLNVGEDVSGYS